MTIDRVFFLLVILLCGLVDSDWECQWYELQEDGKGGIDAVTFKNPIGEVFVVDKLDTYSGWDGKFKVPAVVPDKQPNELRLLCTLQMMACAGEMVTITSGCVGDLRILDLNGNLLTHGCVNGEYRDGKQVYIETDPYTLNVYFTGREIPYVLLNSGQSCESKGYSYITTREACSAAGAALNMADKIALSDKQNRAYHDPPYCYYESNELKFGGKDNYGPCSSSDKCLCATKVTQVITGTNCTSQKYYPIRTEAECFSFGNGDSSPISDCNSKACPPYCYLEDGKIKFSKSDTGAACSASKKCLCVDPKIDISVTIEGVAPNMRSAKEIQSTCIDRVSWREFLESSTVYQLLCWAAWKMGVQDVCFPTVHRNFMHDYDYGSYYGYYGYYGGDYESQAKLEFEVVNYKGDQSKQTFNADKQDSDDKRLLTTTSKVVAACVIGGMIVGAMYFLV